jgi:hypothetical protein
MPVRSDEKVNRKQDGQHRQRVGQKHHRVVSELRGQRDEQACDSRYRRIKQSESDEKDDDCGNRVREDLDKL